MTYSKNNKLVINYQIKYQEYSYFIIKKYCVNNNKTLYFYLFDMFVENKRGCKYHSIIYIYCHCFKRADTNFLPILGNRRIKFG